MAIDIKKLNQEYTKENTALARLNAPGGLKTQIDQWEIDLQNLKNSCLVHQSNLDFAKSKNDKVAQKRHEQALKNLKQQAEALKAKLEKAQATLSEQQKKVDAKLEELSKDPETKKKLDSILYKKYDRKRKAEANKKKYLETIKQVADNHPTVKKLLTGIEGYNKSIKKCNRIINKLTSKTPLTPEETRQLGNETVELSQSKTKLAARKADLVAYFAKNHPEISKDTLEGLHSYGDINRQMQGCDKTIANCTKAMSGLTVSQELRNFSNPDQSLPVIAEEKPSWLHPIKRIKYNIRARKARIEAEENIDSRNEQRKAFRDELKLSKYEYNSAVVQKYLENYEKGLRDAAKSNRNNSGNSR